MRYLFGTKKYFRALSSWEAAWIIVAPVACWLIFTKLCKIAYTAATWLGTGPDGDTLRDQVAWIMNFAWPRFFIAACGTWFLYWIFKRRIKPVAILVIYPLLIFGLAALRSFIPPHRSPLSIAIEWGYRFIPEFQVLLSGLWREPMTAAVLVLAVGTIICFFPDRFSTRVIRGAQVVMALLGLGISIDLVYLIATGQPLSAQIISFSFAHLYDLLPLIQAEVTKGRVFILFLGISLPVFWAFRHKNLGKNVLHTQQQSYLGFYSACAGVLGFALPLISANNMPFERFSDGTLVAFSKTALASPSIAADANVERDFERDGRPKWHSANMKLVATDKVVKKNVVIVMMESVRAMSTTMYDPNLPTMPYLKQLADKGILIQDMSAVIPRTAAAWMAILGGQYPLTNEGTASWSPENAKIPRIRGLAGALREEGYATAFFTPTHLSLLNEIEVVKALGFEKIVAEPDLNASGAEKVGYMGLADEVMVKPILDWTASNQHRGQPFLLSVMTNVGHHPYATPKHWNKRAFDVEGNAGDQSYQNLQDYLNCLSYVDSVIKSMMDGFERQGLMENTLFIFVGDHGQFFGDHGVNQVFNALFEEGLHVPAIIYSPSMVGKGTLVGPRQQIDILPTIAELLGYRITGASLPGLSLLHSVTANRHEYFSSSIEGSYLAARYGNKKFVYDFDRGPIQAFDLSLDPKELRPITISQEEANAVKRDVLEWQAAARLSMIARPSPISETVHWHRH